MPIKRTPPVTFSSWLASAKPDEALTYHIAGKIADDRLFTAAWDAHLEGKVALFQKRVAGRLNYLAVRLSPRGARFLRRAPRLA